MPIELTEAFKAARQNDVPTLREALKHHDVDSRDEHGRTFLHHAAIALAEDAVNFLLIEADILPHIEDNAGKCAAIRMHDTWSFELERTPDDRPILSHHDEILFSIYNKIVDHTPPFTAESDIGDWPLDPRTGMAMSPYKLRKFYPGFLEATDDNESQAIVSRGPQTPAASGHGVPSPK